MLVICPALVADCLETIQEIAGEYRAAFLAAGGEELQLVESLNDSPYLTGVLLEMIMTPEIAACMPLITQLAHQTDVQPVR